MVVVVGVVIVIIIVIVVLHHFVAVLLAEQAAADERVPVAGHQLRLAFRARKTLDAKQLSNFGSGPGPSVTMGNSPCLIIVQLREY